MDIVTLDSMESLQAQNLAAAQDFSGVPGWRLMPHTAQQVANLLHWAQETDRRVALTPADAAQLPECPIWLDLSGLNRVRRHPVADFVIEVETGMTFGELDQILALHNQQFPLSYPADATLLDILAEDRPGMESGLQGLPRDYVLKTEIATPDGQLTISGADVVKNVTGYDLAKLYVGGRNAFGVLTSVTLKLMARTPASQAWLYQPESLENAIGLSRVLLNAHLPLSCCELYSHPGEYRQWHLLAEMSGDALMLGECRATLDRLELPAGEETGQQVDPQTAAVIQDRLQRWPGATTVIEAALPLGRWPDFALSLPTDETFNRLELQIRPAAGLVYISGEGISPDMLETLSKLARAQQGFIQLHRTADWNMAGAYNLPESSAARRLLKSLKSGYDPKGVLLHPQLPL